MAKEKLKIKKGIASVAMRCLPNEMRVVELWLKLKVRKSTKENRGIKHYAFTVIIIICQQNVIFFGALSLRKGALKKNISR